MLAQPEQWLALAQSSALALACSPGATVGAGIDTGTGAGLDGCAAMRSICCCVTYQATPPPASAPINAPISNVAIMPEIRANFVPRSIEQPPVLCFCIKYALPI
jgi:hypothetical protein